MDCTHLPLIPAKAGIQVERTDASPKLLGPRFRGGKRMGVVESIPMKLEPVARLAYLRYCGRCGSGAARLEFVVSAARPPGNDVW